MFDTANEPAQSRHEPQLDLFFSPTTDANVCGGIEPSPTEPVIAATTINRNGNNHSSLRHAVPDSLLQQRRNEKTWCYPEGRSGVLRTRATAKLKPSVRDTPSISSQRLTAQAAWKARQESKKNALSPSAAAAAGFSRSGFVAHPSTDKTKQKEKMVEENHDEYDGDMRKAKSGYRKRKEQRNTKSRSTDDSRSTGERHASSNSEEDDRPTTTTNRLSRAESQLYRLDWRANHKNANVSSPQMLPVGAFRYIPASAINSSTSDGRGGTSRVNSFTSIITESGNGRSSPKKEDLAVAVPLPNEHDQDGDFSNNDDPFTVRAFEYDVDTKNKVALRHRKRFRLVLITVIGIVAISVSGLTIGVIRAVSNNDPPTTTTTVSPTMAPTTVVESNIISLLSTVSQGISVKNGTTPQGKALNWLLTIDPLRLVYNSSATNHDIKERYIAALLYFSLSEDGGWSDCAPPYYGSDNIFFKTNVENETRCTFDEYRTDCPTPLNMTRWLSGEHHCDWGGLSCKTLGVDRYIQDIYLARQQLKGRIPTELGRLTKLQVLSMSSNEIYGSIPSELGNLERLSQLRFANNSLSGPIPTELYRLFNLQVLSLGDNQLSGLIVPSLIGQMSLLQEFYTFNNRFSGSIPSEIGSLSPLQRLAMNNNNHIGRLPSELTNLSRLTELRVDTNLLNGTLPTNIGNLPYLNYFTFQLNDFSGSLPDSFYNLINVQTVFAHDNWLTGTLSSRIGQMTSLTKLYIDNNLFDGSIPSELSNLISLVDLTLDNNNFTSFPDTIVCEALRDTIVVFYADCQTSSFGNCSCCSACCDSTTKGGTCERSNLGLPIGGEEEIIATC